MSMRRGRNRTVGEAAVAADSAAARAAAVVAVAAALVNGANRAGSHAGTIEKDGSRPYRAVSVLGGQPSLLDHAHRFKKDKKKSHGWRSRETRRPRGCSASSAVWTALVLPTIWISNWI